MKPQFGQWPQKHQKPGEAQRSKISMGCNSAMLHISESVVSSVGAKWDHGMGLKIQDPYPHLLIMGCHLAIKKNDALLHATIRMNLENIMLSSESHKVT